METLKILHLEDMLTDVELVSAELKRSGLLFDKLHVDSREDYTRALYTYLPDIILSDHALPNFNSLEALRILKNSGLNIPFILISSAISEEFAVEIMKEGASDYILKDRMQRLPNAVKSAIDKFNLEKQHQKTNRELTLLFDTIDEVYFSIDILKNSLIQISPACTRVYGYSPEEFLAKPTLTTELLYPADRSRVGGVLKRISLGQTVVEQYRVIHKGGDIRWVESKIIPELNELGSLVKLFGVTRDITQRKKVEESLVRSEANLRSVFENIDLSIILFDKNFNVVSFNRQAASLIMTRYNKHLANGQSGLECFPEDSGDFFKGIVDHINRNENVFYETSFTLPDGNIQWQETKWIGIPDRNSVNIGTILTIKNITEKKNADIEREQITSELLKRNKDLEQFTYIVSHNLRAPVANIIGLSDLIQDVPLNDEDSKILTSLARSVRNLDDVIIDLNNILDINNDVNMQKIENVFFADIIESVKSDLTYLIKNENATINLKLGTMSSVSAPRNYLYSIFHNLIINSIKYKRAAVAPVITITSAEEPGKITIKFKDNGKGIDLNKNGNALFGLYKRFDPSVEGKGIGLFMVKTQIENLGGKITVSSELNVGTEFCLEFPKLNRTQSVSDSDESDNRGSLLEITQ